MQPYATSYFRNLNSTSSITTNKAGGVAYEVSPEHALSQYASTGCFGTTFYASSQEQLDKVLALTKKCPPEFVAKCAIYAREQGRLKDMPAMLCAYLSTIDTKLFRKVFKRVIHNGRLLRTFVQIMRSGVVGRKSLGYAPKKAIQEFLDSRTDEQIFYDSVGNSPSLVDVIKMTHPKAKTKQRNALYAYLLGKAFYLPDLPPLVAEYEWAKTMAASHFPNVNFQLLTSLNLTEKQWCEIAKNASWLMLRMNINTFAKHGVFKDPEMVQLIAAKLRNDKEIERARPLPYEIMIALSNIAAFNVPQEIANSLVYALEKSLSNVPEINGDVYICVDTSGSMSSLITGETKKVSTKVRCIDVASLFASSLLRKNPNAVILPFDTDLHPCRLNPNDSLSANTKILSGFGGGGTNCSLPLLSMNTKGITNAKAVIYISDNESWGDFSRYDKTSMSKEWEIFKGRNPLAKLVCIDLTPNDTTQVTNSKDRLNVGGFSNAVFDVVAGFINDGFDGSSFVQKIDAISLDGRI